MDTLGGLIDKLNTVDLKMWNNQELLYEIRKMSFQEYKDKYFKNEDGAELLWNLLKRACDLNIQRNQLVDEIDEMIIKLFHHAKTMGKNEFEDRYLQRKYKTY